MTMGRSSDWWHVIEAMAGYVACGVEYDELDEGFVQDSLLGQGFSKESIEHALDWLEMASVSGNVADVFSMISPVAMATRVPNPLEKIYFSEELWQQFDGFRRSGIISEELAEKLLEGIRTVDTRDWEDEEVRAFFHEVLVSSLPNTPEKVIENLVENGASPEFYC